MEKNPGMFSTKTLIYFRLKIKKTWTSWMTWGWVNYQQFFFFFLKLTAPLKLLVTILTWVKLVCLYCLIFSEIEIKAV